MGPLKQGSKAKRAAKLGKEGQSSENQKNQGKSKSHQAISGHFKGIYLQICHKTR